MNNLLARPLLGLALIVISLGCTDEVNEGASSSTNLWQLPKALREISGLTNTTDGRLLAINDEVGQVYEISFDPDTVAPFMAFGEPPRRGDFEGLTTTASHLYAITSDGELYVSSLTDPKQQRVIDTRLGEWCEIEGLAAHDNLLYVLCKKPRRQVLKDQLVIFAWNILEEQRHLSADLLIPLSRLNNTESLHPSGIALQGNELLVIAAKEKSWVQLSLTGEVTASGQLPDAHSHKQAEGIVVREDGIYIANEGKKRGQLMRYRTLSH